MASKSVDLLNACSPEGQAEREKALCDKKVIFVSCGYDTTKENIYSRAKELGIEAYVLDSSDSNEFLKTLINTGIVNKEHVIDIDLTMRPSIVDDCLEAINKICPNPDAVVTFWDDCVGLCARIAEAMGVIANPVDAIDKAHDKYLSRLALESAGVATPLFFRITSEEQMKEAAAAMEYPAILKPAQGAASIGVSYVKNAEDALESYFRTLEVMKDVMRDGDLMGLIFDNELDAASTFVLEEFIDGEEVDVDMVLKDGEVTYSNINSDWPDVGGRFVELGITFPAKCNDQERGAEFRREALKCCRALGVMDGVVHVEMKYSSRLGPCLVECNPRMGGGPLYKFHQKSFGVDLVTEHLLIHCGLPSAPPALEKPAFFCSCIFIYAGEDGVIERDMKDSPESAAFRLRDYVTDVKFTAKEGQSVNAYSNKDAFPSFIGRVDVAVDTAEMTYDEVTSYCDAMQTAGQDAMPIRPRQNPA